MSDLSPMLADLPVISTHEHHRESDWYRGMTLDKLLANSYVGWTGLLPVRPENRQAFLDEVRHNTYFVWLERGLCAAHGIEPLTAANWDAASAAIERAYASPGWRVDCLRRHGHYRRAIQDSYWQPGHDLGLPDLFAPAFRINMFVMGHAPGARDHNGNSPWDDPGFRPATFEEYLELVEQRVAEARRRGVVALKSALAYDRDLRFKPRERDEAARAFGRPPAEASLFAVRAFQDFVFDHLCALAAKYELPFQNHTGLGQLDGTNPMHLRQMIVRHPRTKFVLLHGGYPWTGEVAALAHNYGNVYPDLTWLPLISTSAAIRALREWLETAHSSRSICWGGDCWTAEESVGAALALKHVLARTLGDIAREGLLAPADAERVARRICFENAAGLYGI